MDSGISPRIAVGLLSPADLDDVLRLCALDPVGSVLASTHLFDMGVATWPTRAQLWGYRDGSELRAACWYGVNLIPIAADEEAAVAFARMAARRSRTCSSIVGPYRMVQPLWRELSSVWDEPRAIRDDQWSMAISTDAPIAGDPRVRRSSLADVDLLLPACLAMLHEELGYPIGNVSASYAHRLRQLIDEGRSLSWIGDVDGERRVVFKAEIGAVGLGVAQIQGVWIDPAFRGRGLAAPGMASVVNYARAKFGPTVSLYVNAFNHAACAAYLRCGFTQVDRFTTVLF